MGLTVDIPDSDNAIRLEQAILLTIHVTARPLHISELIPREEMTALVKLIAEAKLKEQKLSWDGISIFVG